MDKTDKSKADKIKAKYMAIFREEATEHLDNLSLGLLELELRPDDKELIHSLLRAAHALKGSAALMGLEQIKELAQKLEDIFKAIDDKLLIVSTEIVDALLAGTDTIKAIVDSAGSETEIKKAIQKAENKLDAVLAPLLGLEKFWSEAQALFKNVQKLLIKLTEETASAEVLKDLCLKIQRLKELSALIPALADLTPCLGKLEFYLIKFKEHETGPSRLTPALLIIAIISELEVIVNSPDHDRKEPIALIIALLGKLQSL